MALQQALSFQIKSSPLEEHKYKYYPLYGSIASHSKAKCTNSRLSLFCTTLFPHFSSVLVKGCSYKYTRLRASRPTKYVDGKEIRKEDPNASDCNDDDEDDDVKDDNWPRRKAKVNDPYLMNPEERREWRMKIKEVLDKYPDAEEEIDPEEKKKKMQKLLADYPLVAEEDDPDWPEDADGWGFNLGQFFDKITIKNKKKDEDDENYDSDKEIVWKDDNYIQAVKDITTAEWEEAVYKDISPLIVLVHNRYRRPKENERALDELVKAVQIIWDCRLPSPRCVAIDAVKETGLVSALKVNIFPEIIFTKAGKILYREKVIRSADEFSKIMAYFYYGAAKPSCLGNVEDHQESIPMVTVSSR